MELARQQIERLVRERLTGRKTDGVSFVEELLSIVAVVGEVCCTPAGDRGLRFEMPDDGPFEVDLDANHGKLRMLCARLAVLCQESGYDFLPYGGEGTIRQAWKARWANTPDRHEFTITAVR